MLSKTTLQKITSLLGLNQADVDAAVAATEEKDLVIPDGLTVLSTADLATRDKAKYEAGGTAKLEMFIKEQKQTLGLEFEGKDPAKFIEALSAKVLSEAGKEPDAASKEKDGKIKKLEKLVVDKQQEMDTLNSKFETASLNSEIMKAVPANLREGMDAEEVVALMKTKGYEFAKKDGKIVAMKHGEVLEDNKAQPVGISDVIKNYATERNWLDVGEDKNKAGRGEGHSKTRTTNNTGKATSLSQATEAWEADGKKVGTADFSRHIEELQKENPKFDLELSN